MRALRTLVAGTAAAALALGLGATSAQAVTPGPLDNVATVAGSDVNPYAVSMAELPSGEVAVAYAKDNSVTVTLRKPGHSAFEAPITHPVSLGTVGAAGNATSAPRVTVLPLGTARFLLGWVECPSTCQVMAAELSATATAFPIAKVLSGGDAALDVNARFAVAADGSAAAMWLRAGSGAQDVRVTQRNGFLGDWQSPATVASTSLSMLFDVAIDTGHQLTAAWTDVAGSAFAAHVKVRTGASWGTDVLAGQMHVGAFYGNDPFLDVESAGGATVMAVVTDTTGDSEWFGDATPMGVNVYARVAGATRMTRVKTAQVGPGRFALMPTVAMASDGSASVHFADFSSPLPGAPSQTVVTTLLMQRRGALGTWTGPLPLTTVADTAPLSDFALVPARGQMLADGTFVMPTYRPILVSSSVSKAAALQVKSGWGVAATDPQVSGEWLGVGNAFAAVNAAGRATMLYVNSVGNIVVDTTVAVRPVASVALSSASPRRGVAVTCKATWVEAATVTYRWLRNGVAISGATGRSYTPRSTDVGTRLSCRSTGDGVGGIRTVTSVARWVG